MPRLPGLVRSPPRFGSTPQFFGRKIEEAGAKDGEQTGYMLFFLQIFGAAAGAAASSTSGGGSGANAKSNPRVSESHSSVHVQHAATPHVGAAHSVASPHVPSAPRVGSAPAHAPHETRAAGEPHGGHESEHGHHEEEHGGREGAPRDEGHGGREEQRHHRAELRLRLTDPKLRGRVGLQVQARPAMTELIILSPGAGLPLATFTALGADEATACDEATMQALEANACVADPDDLDMADCVCTGMTDVNHESRRLCSITSGVACQAPSVPTMTPPGDSGPPPTPASAPVPPAPIAISVPAVPVAAPGAAIAGNDAACTASAACNANQSACNAGQPEACASLGGLYAYGLLGVAKDEVRAASLFQLACNADPASNGCTSLANLYATGTGVPKDRAKALELSKRSCGAPKGVAAACAMVDSFGDPAYAVAHLRPMCDANDWMGCSYLTSHKAEKPHAVEQLRKMCVGGNETACSFLKNMKL